MRSHEDTSDWTPVKPTYMPETDVAVVKARAHPAYKFLGVKKLYGNSRVTYDLRAGVYSDASGLFSSRYGIVP